MKKAFILICWCLFSPFVSGQNSVSVSVTMVPPYSTRLSDYANQPGKTIVSLRNTTTRPLDVYLRMGITGENGIRVFTQPNYRAPVPITLQPGMSKILNVAELQTLFDLNDISFVGTSARDIGRTGGLPEGVYEICVRAYDFDRPTVPLSGETPMGCTTLRLTLTEPPMLIRPLESEDLTLMEPQNLLFSWTFPAGAPPGTLYLLRIVEMFDATRNPNDAFLSATGPVFFEKEVAGNTYLYGPGDPPLVRGRKYAWSVKALDKTLNGNSEGTAFRNGGRSEVRSFTPRAITERESSYEMARPSALSAAPDFVIQHLSGKLRYYWMKEGGSSTTNNWGQAPGSFTTSVNTTAATMNAATQTLSMTGNSGGFSTYQNSPMAGVTVQLVEALQFESPTLMGTSPGLLPGNILTHQGDATTVAGHSLRSDVLATALTDAGGNFSFNVPGLKDMDFTWKQTSLVKGGNEFGYTVSGRARKVLMVRIGAPSSSYYSQPIQFFYGAGAQSQMGTFYSVVKTFNPKVLVADKNNRALTKDNMEVLLVRKTPRPSYLPKDEGSPGDFSDPELHGSLGYEVVAKAVTNASGIAQFRHIPIYYCNNSQSPFLIFVRPKDSFTTSFSLNSVFPNGQPLRYASESDYNDPVCYNTSLHQLKESCFAENCLVALAHSGTTNYVLPGQDPSFSNFTFAPVSPTLPRIYAVVKNTGAGNDNDLAQNEPNAIWALWRVNLPAAQLAASYSFNGKWGEVMESGKTGFAWLSGKLSEEGHPLHLQKMGITGQTGLSMHASCL